MATIIALIHGEPGAYGIGFPDFPGAVSGGSTIDEALHRGRATLAAHIEAIGEVGQDLPRVRTIDEVRAVTALEPDFADAVLVTTIEVDLPEGSVRADL